MKLSPKQQAFADFYIELGNATEAAKKAGYSEKTARFIGNENLTKPNIKAYIYQRMEVLKSERVADQQEILELITGVLRGEISGTALVGVGKGAQEVEDVPPTVTERIKAAELLGKRHMMWVERQRVEGATSVTIVNDLDD